MRKIPFFSMIMFIVVPLMILMAFVSTCEGRWITSMYENFERNENWTWDNWEILPSLPGDGPNHTWGREDSTIYYVLPRQYRSLWCSGLPNDLIPGVDTYAEGMNAWAIYGPYQLPDSANEIGGLFYMFGEMANLDERFALAVTDNPNNFGELDSCPIAFEFDWEDTDGEWLMIPFDIANLDSLGDSISYMNRDSIYFCWVFQSDYIRNEDLMGIFIDNVYIGYNDGMPDYEITNVMPYTVNGRDTVLANFPIMAGTPYYFGIDFTAYSGEVDSLYGTHRILLNEDNWHAITQWWRSSPTGIHYTLIFPEAFTFEPSESDTIHATLDTNDDENESNERFNNYMWVQFPVYEEQLSVEIIWIEPTDTSYITEGSSPIIIQFTAFNSPVDEYFTLYGHIAGSRYISNLFTLRLHNDDERPIVVTDTIGQEDLTGFRNEQLILFVESWDDDEQYSISYCPFPLIKNINSVNELPLNYDDDIQYSVYPNPFNSSVNINFNLKNDLNVVTSIYNILGKQLLTNSRIINKGLSQTSINMDMYPSGSYFLKINDSTTTIRIVK